MFVLRCQKPLLAGYNGERYNGMGALLILRLLKNPQRALKYQSGKDGCFISLAESTIRGGNMEDKNDSRWRRTSMKSYLFQTNSGNDNSTLREVH